MRTPKPSTGGNEAAPNEPWVKTAVRRQRANKEVVMFQTKTVVLGLVSLLVTGIGAAQQPTPAQPWMKKNRWTTRFMARIFGAAGRGRPGLFQTQA